MLENTSSLMLMGYLIRTHEERTPSQADGPPGLRLRLKTGGGECAEARQLPREPVRERRPCSSICTHSYLSKGCDLDPRAVLDEPAMFGLDGVAFTETNTQDGCDELFEIGAKSKVKVFVGLGSSRTGVEYLCFFPKPELAPEPVQMWGSNREKPWSAAECLPKVRSLGAAIVAARPYDRDTPNPAMDYVRSLSGLLCAVEGYNARVNRRQRPAVEAAEALKLPCTGGR